MMTGRPRTAGNSDTSVVVDVCRLMTQAMGIAVELGPEGVARCIHEAGVGFMMAPRYHPAMAAVVPVRRSLKVRAVPPARLPGSRFLSILAGDKEFAMIRIWFRQKICELLLSLMT